MNYASTQHAGPSVAISWGELFDRIVILEIKSERLTNQAALENVGRELAGLREAAAGVAADNEILIGRIADLREVNVALWDIENAIRACERNADFGDTFIQLARSVYKKNDKRAFIKREINLLLGSALIEEKSYDESESLRC